MGPEEGLYSQFNYMITTRDLRHNRRLKESHII